MAKPFWPLMIVRVFQGIGWPSFHVTWTLVSKVIPDTQRGQGLSYFYWPSTSPLPLLHPSEYISSTISVLRSFRSLHGSLVVFLIYLHKPREFTRRPLELQEGAATPIPVHSRGDCTFCAHFLVERHLGSMIAFFPLFALTRGRQPDCSSEHWPSPSSSLEWSRKFLDVPDGQESLSPARSSRWSR